MPSPSQHTTDVLIIGAGPVGLTLAMDLATRGVQVTIVEQRARHGNRRVKCNHISARSMEIFRRLGVAQALRNNGLPPDHPNDCAFRTTVTGQELTRIPIPARQDRYTARQGPDTWWPTPEPPHRLTRSTWNRFCGTMQRRWRTSPSWLKPNSSRSARSKGW